MVNDNVLYNNNKVGLDKELEYAFDGIKAEGNELIPLIEIFKQNQKLDINSFENKEAEEFKQHIEQFQE